MSTPFPPYPDDEVPLGIAEDDALLQAEDTLYPEPEAPPAGDPAARRRADIDAKQEKVGRVLEEMGCEGVILLMPAHVAWFTGGMNVRGLIADGERPGVYTNGRQRWLLCSNTDTQRLFDEELDGLGFQLKEWPWYTGRAALLSDIVSGKKTATDRPFPNMPLITDRLRADVRALTPHELDQYRELGAVVAHALEATARTVERGQAEAEVAGHVAHRLYRHGAEAAAVSVAADGRAGKFRRAGFTEAQIEKVCVLQATGCRGGLFVTAARTVCFGPPDPAFRSAFDLAAATVAAYRAFSLPGETVGAAGEAGRGLAANGPFEYDWRHTQPGYGAGRFPAEELRRFGRDEPFAPGWPIVWQARVGPAAVVDTVVVASPGDEVVVGADGPAAVTPPTDWPFKRVRVRGQSHDVPDVLVR